METELNSSTKLKVLCLEDSPRDIEIMRELLADAGLDVDMDCTAVEKEFASLLRQRKYDIILSDFKLPGFDAFAALQWSMEICPDVPFVCISGTVGEEIAIELLKQGAVDYVLKDRLARLPSAIQRALAEAKEREARQRAEEALRESEQRLRPLYESDLIGVIHWNMDGQITAANDKFLKMVGYSRDELAAGLIDWSTMTPPEFRNLDVASAEELKATGVNKTPFEKEYIRKDGIRVPVYIAGAMLDEKRFNGVAFVLDISERKREEEALRESEEKLRHIFENAQDVYYEVSLDGTIMEISPSIEILSNGLYRRSDLLGKSIYGFYSDPAERTTLLDRLQRHGSVTDFEITLKNRDGASIPCSMSSKIMLDSEQKPARILGSIRDVTERKRAHEELRKSEKRLREAQEMAHLGFWTWNVKTGEVEWSEEVFKIFCLDPKKFTPQIDSILALSPWPEDHHRDQELIKKAIETHSPGSYEQKFLRPDQSIGHYYSTFHGVYDEKGDLISIVGTVLDITERKRIEELLRSSEVMYRRLFEAARDGILIVEAETGMVIDVNPFMVEMLDYSREQFFGKRVWELGFFKDDVANKLNFAELRQKEFIQYENLPLETASGRSINVEFVSHIYDVGSRKVMQCNIRNITERRRAEEKILHQLEELRRWQEVTLGREDRNRQLKREVNELLVRLGEAIRYPSQQSTSSKQETENR